MYCERVLFNCLIMMCQHKGQSTNLAGFGQFRVVDRLTGILVKI